MGSALLTEELGFREEPLESGKYKSIMADQVFITKEEVWLLKEPVKEKGKGSQVWNRCQDGALCFA